MQIFVYVSLLAGFIKLGNPSRDLKLDMLGIQALLDAHKVLEGPKAIPCIIEAPEENIVVATVADPQSPLPKIAERLNIRKILAPTGPLFPRPPSVLPPYRFTSPRTLQNGTISHENGALYPAATGLCMPPQNKVLYQVPHKKALHVPLYIGIPCGEESPSSLYELAKKSTNTRSTQNQNIPLLAQLLPESIDEPVKKDTKKIASAKKKLSLPLSALWQQKIKNQAEIIHTTRTFERTNCLGIVSVVAGHMKYDKDDSKLTTTRHRYGIKIGPDSFEISSSLKYKIEKMRTPNPLAVGGIIGELNGQNLEITAENDRHFYHVYLHRPGSIREVKPNEPVLVQNHDVLLIIPSGITREVIVEGLNKVNAYSQAIDFWASYYFKHFERNADFIVATIGHN